MIALCAEHHKKADAGAFTKDQIREFKAKPFLSSFRGGPGGIFDWRREQLLVRAGQMKVVNFSVLLELAGRPAIWLSRDEHGHELLNLDMWDSSGTLVFSMRDNEWVLLSKPEDFECPPSGRSLILRAPKFGIRLTIEFRSLSQSDFTNLIRQDTLAGNKRMVASLLADAKSARASGNEMRAMMLEDAVRSMDLDAGVDQVAKQWITDALKMAGGEIVLCDLTADYPFPVDVHLTPTRIRLPNNNIVSGGMAINVHTALSIG